MIEQLGRASAPRLSGRTVLLVVFGQAFATDFVDALERSGANVYQVAGLDGARRALGRLGPRAAVLVCTGTQVVPPVELAIASRGQDAAVIVSAAANPADRAALVEHGADCVLRSLRPDEAVSLLAALLRRTSPHPVAVRALQAGPVRVDLGCRTVTVNGIPVHLTALEFDLLAYCMAHRGEVLSREQLRADVWRYDIGGLETVTVHVRRLRSKIESDPSKPSMITTVWGTGYRFVGGEASAMPTAFASAR